MPNLPTKSYNQIVIDQVTAIQAYSSELIDFTIGSILRALVESNAGNSVWLESLITTLLSAIRLSTSHGEDVDTFVEDFNLERDPAKQASGPVVFSRFTPTTVAIISASTVTPAQVSSPVGNQTFSVYADPANINYDPVQNAYVIPIGISSIPVPVIDNVAGAAGNVAIGEISVIATVIPGVDTVTNTVPFTNGADQESDDQLKARFILYIEGLSKATRSALAAALLAVSGLTRYSLTENENPDGSDHLGFFFAVVDDGSGSPPSGMIANASAQMEATRGFTIAYSVLAPTIINVNIVMQVHRDSISTDLQVANLIVTYITTYINNLNFASEFEYTRIPQLVYDSTSHVLNVRNITLNGGTSDLTATPQQLFRIQSITVTFF